jgi:cellulose synthase/poly-beta-1,6-N-acetylglucosamine synthase-like glycosyltransferase
MSSLFELIFWCSVLFIAATTAGYPLLITALSIFAQAPRTVRNDEPTVTLIIAAHNEEKVIKEKLVNSLSLDYPKEKLDIIVASDGSTDKTDEIVSAFAGRGVMLQAYGRLGKTGIQNESVKRANGEILVFSDANAMYRTDAIRKLVRNFADEKVGCVSGQLIYRRKDRCAAGESEGCYWTYEKYLKKKESALSSLLGVNGSIYAVRKEDYVQIDNRLISDFVEPLEIVRRGKKVIYEPEAVSEEDPSVSYDKELRRKIRILTRSIQGLLYMKSLFNPIKYGIFSLQLFLHKACRYLVPFFLVAGGLCLLALAGKPFYSVLFFLMVTFLLLAAAARLFSDMAPGSRIIKVFNLIYYYFLVNYAVTLAWVNVLRGSEITVWTTDRKETTRP